MAARCDSLQGCTESPVSDGTACGEADCVSAHVCIQGACAVRPVPEGAACGRGSLCQQQGRCTAQVCVLPAVTSTMAICATSADDDVTCTGTLAVSAVLAAFPATTMVPVGAVPSSTV